MALPPVPAGFAVESELPPVPEGFEVAEELPPIPEGFAVAESTPPKQRPAESAFNAAIRRGAQAVRADVAPTIDQGYDTLSRTLAPAALGALGLEPEAPAGNVGTVAAAAGRAALNEYQGAVDAGRERLKSPEGVARRLATEADALEKAGNIEKADELRREVGRMGAAVGAGRDWPARAERGMLEQPQAPTFVRKGSGYGDDLEESMWAKGARFVGGKGMDAVGYAADKLGAGQRAVSRVIWGINPKTGKPYTGPEIIRKQLEETGDAGPLVPLLEGLTGSEEAGVEATGLVLETLTDPLTYTGVGTLTKGGKGARAIMSARQAGRDLAGIAPELVDAARKVSGAEGMAGTIGERVATGQQRLVTFAGKGLADLPGAAGKAGLAVETAAAKGLSKVGKLARTDKVKAAARAFRANALLEPEEVWAAEAASVGRSEQAAMAARLEREVAAASEGLAGARAKMDKELLGTRDDVMADVAEGGSRAELAARVDEAVKTGRIAPEEGDVLLWARKTTDDLADMVESAGVGVTKLDEDAITYFTRVMNPDMARWLKRYVPGKTTAERLGSAMHQADGETLNAAGAYFLQKRKIEGGLLEAERVMQDRIAEIAAEVGAKVEDVPRFFIGDVPTRVYAYGLAAIKTKSMADVRRRVLEGLGTPVAAGDGILWQQRMGARKAVAASTRAAAEAHAAAEAATRTLAEAGIGSAGLRDIERLIGTRERATLRVGDKLAEAVMGIRERRDAVWDLSRRLRAEMGWTADVPAVGGSKAVGYVTRLEAAAAKLDGELAKLEGLLPADSVARKPVKYERAYETAARTEDEMARLGGSIDVLEGMREPAIRAGIPTSAAAKAVERTAAREAKRGAKATETAREAAEALATMEGAPPGMRIIDGHAVTEDVANFLGRLGQGNKTLAGMQPVIDFLTLHPYTSKYWKPWSLSVRPGFHVRNWLGGAWVNHLAGDIGLGEYRDADKLLRGATDPGYAAKTLIRVDGGATDTVENVLRRAADSGADKQGWATSMDEYHRRLLDTQGRSEPLGRLAIEHADSPAVRVTNRALKAVQKQTPVVGPALSKVYHWLPLVPANSEHHALLKLGGKAGDYVERQQRLAHFLGKVRAGLGDAEAARSVKEYLFNPGDLTDVERGVMSRLFPFWGWMRNNMGLQIANLIKQPGKYGAQVRLARLIDDEDAPPTNLLSESKQSLGAIRLGKMKDGKVPVSWQGGIHPAADIFGAARMMGGLGGPEDQALQSLVPGGKMVLGALGVPTGTRHSVLNPDAPRAVLGSRLPGRDANIIEAALPVLATQIERLNPGGIFGRRANDTTGDPGAPPAVSLLGLLGYQPAMTRTREDIAPGYAALDTMGIPVRDEDLNITAQRKIGTQKAAIAGLKSKIGRERDAGQKAVYEAQLAREEAVLDSIIGGYAAAGITVD